MSLPQTKPSNTHSAEVIKRRWLSEKTFEIELTRPAAFDFAPGQRIRLMHQGLERDYSLVSAPGDRTLALCIRYLESGALSPILAAAGVGSRFCFSGPHGYFLYRPARRPVVFVATGTGIAPFCSMARAGVKGFLLLHGVRSPDELYYDSVLRAQAGLYVPCLSATANPPAGCFPGRVTDYFTRQLQRGLYEFYVCGRGDMVRDVTLLVDDRFQGSLVFTEIFY